MHSILSPSGDTPSTPSGDFTKWCALVDSAGVNPQALRALRVARLQQLVAERFGGNQSKLADATGRQARYFNDVLGGRKSFGEKVCRDIEAILDLPARWFDTTEGTPSVAEPQANYRASRAAANDYNLPFSPADWALVRDEVKEPIVDAALRAVQRAKASVPRGRRAHAKKSAV